MNSALAMKLILLFCASVNAHRDACAAGECEAQPKPHQGVAFIQQKADGAALKQSETVASDGDKAANSTALTQESIEKAMLHTNLTVLLAEQPLTTKVSYIESAVTKLGVDVAKLETTVGYGPGTSPGAAAADAKTTDLQQVSDGVKAERGQQKHTAAKAHGKVDTKAPASGSLAHRVSKEEAKVADLRSRIATLESKVTGRSMDVAINPETAALAQAGNTAKTPADPALKSRVGRLLEDLDDLRPRTDGLLNLVMS